MKPGQLVDVKWEQKKHRDPATGVEELWHSIDLWADAGLNELIKSIPGVTNVYSSITPTQYSVYVDERFDVQFVAAEIEAAILCDETPRCEVHGSFMPCTLEHE